MPATMLAAITPLEMIGLGEYNQSIFKVVVNYAVLFFPIIAVSGHLNTNCVGPIPVVTERTNAPELV